MTHLSTPTMVLTLTKNLQHKIFHQYSVLALYNICIRSKDHTWLSAPWPNQWLVTAWRILHCRRWDIGSGTRSSKPWFPWRACWKSCSSVSFSAGVFSFWGPLTFWLVGNVADELSLQLGRSTSNNITLNECNYKAYPWYYWNIIIKVIYKIQLLLVKVYNTMYSNSIIFQSFFKNFLHKDKIFENRKQ